MVSPEQQRLDLQLVWALEQLPELVAVMRERVTPTIVYGFSATGGASSGGMKDRLPVVVPVLDDLTQTWRLVTEFVTDFANHLHEQVDRSGTARVGGLRHVRLRWLSRLLLSGLWLPGQCWGGCGCVLGRLGRCLRGCRRGLGRSFRVPLRW